MWGGYDASIDGVTTGVAGANQTYVTNEAFQFDGQDDTLSMGDVLGSVLTGEHTLAFWGKYDGSSSWMPFVGKEGVSRTWIGEDNGWDYTNSAKSVKPVYTVPDITVWHHYIVACGSSSETYYLDGSEVATTSVGRVSDNTSSFEIGHDGKTNYGGGLVDDPRVFSKRVSASEAANLYETGSIHG